MAAKLKKRLSKVENKLLKLDKLELNDVICSICQSVLVEPVTLPCYHDFCHRCFKGSIENNALCCPLCRLRIGSWVRKSTKQKNLVNTKLWNFIKNKFSNEIDRKLKGEDVEIPSETPLIRLSAPGEIRAEYEAELTRLRAERLQLENKQFHESENLIKKLQKEEEETHSKYLERLKQDELLAKQLQQESVVAARSEVPKNNNNIKISSTRHRLKPTTIDSYLSKTTRQATITKNSPLLTDDNTSTDMTTPIVSISSNSSRMSPEILPNYGKILKNFVDRKAKNRPSTWSKENGEKTKTKKQDSQINEKESENNIKAKPGVQSLLVSLPLPQARLPQKANAGDANLETSSVDSMQQELCYFKPIEATTPTSFSHKDLPLRVPCIRIENHQFKSSTIQLSPPSREKYLDNLCRLRDLSLARKLPSAFVIMLSILRPKKDSPKKSSTNTRSRAKKNLTMKTCIGSILPKRNSLNKYKKNSNDSSNKISNHTAYLRRTRSMGSIHKDENEITPKKKVKERKYHSNRKPYLRSDSKRMHSKMESRSPTPANEIYNSKVNLAVKNLSSPLENCDVKNILREQLRIEKMIEQEKRDLELARKMDAEWNGRRQLRRAPAKRPLPLASALRPAKKLKVSFFESDSSLEEVAI